MADPCNRTTPTRDWHSIEIWFTDIAERDAVRDEIEQLLAGRGTISVQTWAGVPWRDAGNE